LLRIVEICCSLPPTEQTKFHVESFLRSSYVSLPLNHRLDHEQLQASCLKNIEFIQVCELFPDENASSVELDMVELEIFTYLLQEDQVDSEYSTKLILPNVELLDQWENLVFDDDLKLSLLDYMNTGLLFGDLEVNSNIIAVNRVLLLYG
jgi:hypothetical protein